MTTTRKPRRYRASDVECPRCCAVPGAPCRGSDVGTAYGQPRHHHRERTAAADFATRAAEIQAVQS